MYPIYAFALLAPLLLLQTSACMHYSATFPYATHLPFEATLTDNGVVTCWISMTYDQHEKEQASFSNHQRARPGQVPQITQKQISLTGAKPVRNNGTKDREGGDVQRLARQEGRGAIEEGIKGVWIPWEFKCLDGHQARAGIGLRAVWYSAHGQEFEFVPKCDEDVLGEKWVYGVDLWC
jgi:hypothetical protein